MMVPKKSLFFAGATLLCMSSAFAQNAQSKKVARVQNKVMNTASIDLQTGVITRGPSIKQKAAGPTATAVSLNNLDFAGFIGIDSGAGSGNGPCEWFSSAIKGSATSGGQSTYMTSYLFAYCSIAQDPLSGGPGATATMNFWDGFTNGVALTAGTTGTNILSVTLTGLPGNTGLTAFLINGFARCQAFVFNVGVGGGVTPIVVPDSAIAVSFRFDDLDSLGTLGATSTFLSCVQSCSGLGLDSDGMVDRIDNYCAGAFLTSFSFFTAGFGASFSSVSFQIRELCPITSTSTSSNGTGGNTVNTQVLASPVIPTLGGPLTWTADNAGFGSGGSGNTFFVVAFVPRASEADLGSKLGTLLVNDTPGTGLPAFIVPNSAGSPATLSAPAGFGVPLELPLFGATFFLQAFVGGAGNPNPVGATNLTNLLTFLVGSEM